MFKRYWWVFPVSLALGPVLGVVVAGVIVFAQPRQYESRATLQVRPRPVSMEVTPGLALPQPLGPTFFPTEFEIIKGQATLDAVASRLDLATRWGIEPDAARARLRGMIETENIRGTDLIEIRVRASTPAEARAIAAAVSEAYRTRRTELERQRAMQAIQELQAEVLKQQDLVEDKRKALTRIIRQDKLPYAPGGTPVDPAARTAMQLAQVEADKTLLESQIETLLRYEGAQLMTYAAGLNLPENIIRTLHPQYLEAQRQLDALQLQGLGPAHPNFRQQQEFVDGLRTDLDEAVVALRQTLRARLELAAKEAERLKSRLTATPASQAPAFEDAMTDFEAAQRVLEQLKIKQISEEIQMRITEDPVIVHEDPTAPAGPAFPHLVHPLLTGAGVGLVLGLLAPFVIIPLLPSRSRGDGP